MDRIDRYIYNIILFYLFKICWNQQRGGMTWYLDQPILLLVRSKEGPAENIQTLYGEFNILVNVGDIATCFEHMRAFQYLAIPQRSLKQRTVALEWPLYSLPFQHIRKGMVRAQVLRTWFLREGGSPEVATMWCNKQHWVPIVFQTDHQTSPIQHSILPLPSIIFFHPERECLDEEFYIPLINHFSIETWAHIMPMSSP